MRNRPRPCLQGNLRLGHEQLKAGSDRSILVWYGLLPLPWHSPQAACSSWPRLVHFLRWAASSLPAFADAGSGARASTCSIDQCVGIGVHSAFAAYLAVAWRESVALRVTRPSADATGWRFARLE